MWKYRFWQGVAGGEEGKDREEEGELLRYQLQPPPPCLYYLMLFLTVVAGCWKCQMYKVVEIHILATRGW